MAIIWMDGFNYQGATYLSQNYIGTSNTSTGQTAVRYDGFSLFLQDSTTEASRLTYGPHLSISPITTLSMGIAFRRSNDVPTGLLTLGRPQFMFYNGTTTADATMANMIAGVSITSPANYPTTLGPWMVNIMNRSGNLIQTPINNWNTNTGGVWNYVEIELITSATAGVLRVYTNGVLATSVTNANFSTSTGTTAVNKIGILPNDYSSSYNQFYDDFYVTNTSTRIGEMHIATIRPNADTAQKQWTPSTGTTNFNMVNTTNYGALSTYVTTNVSGRKDLYDMQDMSVTTVTGNIAAIKANGYGYKTAFGTSNVNLVVKSASTEVNGTAVDLIEGTSGAKPIPSLIQEVDPATSAAWTTAGVNAVQMGIRSN